MALSMLSLGTLNFLHLSNAILSKKFVEGSPPPLLVAVATSCRAFVNTWPRALSAAPFLLAIFADFGPVCESLLTHKLV